MPPPKTSNDNRHARRRQGKIDNLVESGLVARAKASERGQIEERAINMGAFIKQPDGTLLLKDNGKGQTEAWTLGGYLYVICNRQGMDTSDIKKVIKLAMLSRRIHEAGKGKLALTAEEISLLKAELPGQAAPFIYGVLEQLDPASLKAGGDD